jgi:hypothetical protein
MFIFDILNKYALCPELLAMIGFQILRLYTHNLDLFFIPNYKTNNKAFSFLPIVHGMANTIFYSLDIFNSIRDDFKFNTLFFLKNPK